MKQPNKFVGLHAHSGFSTFDGLSYPQDHIDFVKRNNMSAWALTDHGHMNGFAHAYLHVQKLNKAGANFKFIPGCEMYVHPDLDVWKVDYELAKARKKGDQEAIKMWEEERQKLATPLFYNADKDGEILGVGLEDSTLTIENEEESKSGKFYDPVKRRHHLVVLPKTSIGLERLFGLVSRGYSEGFYRFPRVDYKMLKEAAKGGHLMVSSACIGGPFAYEVFKYVQELEFDELKPELLDNSSFRDKVMSGMANVYDRLSDSVGRENVLLELQFNKLNAQHLVNRALMDFAKQNSLNDRLVVTCDSHYSDPEHWKEREIYKKLGWLNHKEFNPDDLPQSRDDLKCELYPKNSNQVWDTYLSTTKDYDWYNDDLICEAIERTHDVAYEEIGEIHPDTSMKLPSYVIPKEKTADGALIEMAKEGLVNKGLHKDKEYVERLKYELKIIQSKKFSEYFITMKAIIDLAKTEMFIGPGRGSGAGSLVNYVLGITDVDPIKYGLLFERFMSPERTEFPDIDTDVSDRDKLIDLLKNKFGSENIVPISNYNTFKLKSLIKDISRFYGLPFHEVNKAVASLERDVKNGCRRDGIEMQAGAIITFEEALKYSESVTNYIEEHPEIAEPIEVLFKQNKALGRHAGGVIISERIGERMPLIMARGELQTPWVEGMSFKHLEHFGWIKFDLLGLETLRIMERAIELILKRHEGIESPTFKDVRDWYEKHMSPSVIDFNDQKVYESTYHAGRWAAIFQCTHKGAQKLFQRAKPKSLVDLATLTSIYRPGPLKAKVDRLYIKNKANPEIVNYKHPLIKEVLEETYGCIIFQEQVMQLANQVAGIPKAECNKIRKMMKPTAGSDSENIKKAAALKDRFVTGAVENGVDRSTASALYDDILKFASYGFNKSHAIAYSMDSFFCAWLMTYYEEEWLCAYLEATCSNPKKRDKSVGEVKSLGYNIVPIDINKAEKSWAIIEGKKFMPSFYSCKGIGEAAVDEILEKRPYTNVYDLLWNEDGTWKHSKFNKRVLENLVKIRAMKSMDFVGNDSTFSSYSQAHEIIINNFPNLRKSLKKNKFQGQDNMKELLLELSDHSEWSPKELLEFESSLLGTMNPESILTDEILQKLKDKDIRPLSDFDGNNLYWCMVTNAMPKLTRNKRPYLMLEVISTTGKRERLFCWGWNGKTEIEKYTPIIIGVEENDFGKATKWSRLKIIKV